MSSEVTILPGWGGKRDGAGRPMGAIQRNSFKTFRQLLEETFNLLEVDGFSMYEWSKTNQKEFYRICSRLIPQEITAKVTNENIIPELKQLTFEQLEKLAQIKQIENTDTNNSEG